MEQKINNIYLDKKNIESIVKTVCEFYALKPKKVFSNTRKGEIVKARQVIQYLIKKNTKKSLECIGKVSLDYGRKKSHDHASVLHSFKKIIGLIEVDKDFRDEINQINVIYKKRKEIITKEDVDFIEKNEMQLKYEELIDKKNSEIKNLKNSINEIEKNLNKNYENDFIKKLMVLDEGIIKNFAETRIKPYLMMLEGNARPTSKNLSHSS
tara:strand:- start:7091 stop:7720 length:630 start_codon:yes stop_codon:yes gene_type:complete